MFTGYSNSGAQEYSIGSQRGIGFVQDAPAGSTMTGGDGSSWTKNADGTTSITRGSDSWLVGHALGNFQNSMDALTRQSDKSSARSLDYAQSASDWSASQAAIANAFNAAEAAKNRDWQEYMSGTAHQREVADLRAAGLNPVLSALNGNGAPVTSGATAQANMPQSHAGESTNASGAIASLLSSMLGAQTALANQAMSARTQEAIADKNLAMSQLLAELQAATSRYVSDNSASASRYSADSSRAASKYSADRSYDASIFGAQSSSAASRYSADMQYKIHRDFPNSLYSAAGSVGLTAAEAIKSVFSALDSVGLGTMPESSKSETTKRTENYLKDVIRDVVRGRNSDPDV